MIEILRKIWRFAGEEQKNIRTSIIGCFFFALGGKHPVAVTLRRMLMDTLGHEGVTIVGVFVGARRTLGIAAGLIVDVRTVQFFCDAAAFLTAFMGTLGRLGLLYFR